jgi:hypothetical protein
MSAEQVNALVGQLAGNQSLQVKSFESLLGTSLKSTSENPYWGFHEFTLSSGPFANGELRLHKTDQKALLSLGARDASGVSQGDLDLKRWGEVRHLNVNPRIPPEGVDSYMYKVNGVQLTFQFTHQSHRLYMVVLEWGVPDN